MELNESFTDDLTNHSSYSSDIEYAVNETSKDSKIEVNWAYAVAIPMVCILTVIGNLGTMNAFRKLPELWEKPCEMLILSLSCADLMTGLLVLPPAPQWITPGYWPFGEIHCRIIIACSNISSMASILNICAISFDRFLLVYKEYPQYMKIQSKRRIRTKIAFIWLTPLIWVVIDQSLWDFAKTSDERASRIDFTQHCDDPPVYIPVVAGVFYTIGFVPPIVLGGISTAFFYFLHKRLTKSWELRAESQIRNRLTTVSSSVEPTRRPMSREQRKQYIKPAIVLSVLVSAMALCNLPWCVYEMVKVFCPECFHGYDLEVRHLCLFLISCNAMLDPFLYAMTQSKILRLYKVGFIKCCMKSNKYKQ